MLNNGRRRLRIALLYMAPLVLCLQVIACRHVNIGPRPPTGGDLPQIISFEVDPPQIIAGSGRMAILKWETANAVQVRISGLGEVPLAGSRSVTPQRTTTYTLTATNSAGQTVSESRPVTVGIPREVPPGRRAPVERTPRVLSR